MNAPVNNRTIICWSCEKRVEAGLACPHCKAVLPPDAQTDHFAVLDVEKKFSLDLEAVEKTYRKKARALHPDRFARADARARRAAMQRTVQLNEAWRTLKDPFKRAAYLIALREDRNPGAVAEAVAAPDTKMPQDFLVAQLERREALMEAQHAHDHRAIRELVAEAQAAERAGMAKVARELDAWPLGNVQEAAQALAEVRYHRRFLEEAEPLAEGGAGFEMAGASHGG